jgi:hypothetical protein
MNELHGNTEAIINIHVLIRDRICGDICPGGKYCRDLDCLERFFRQAGKIEMKMEELRNGDKKADD